MARTVTTVVMFDQRMYVGNGLVNRWLRNVMGKMYANTYSAAPARSGTMRGSLRASVIHRGPRQLEGQISVNTPYARHVLGGTAFQGRRYIYTTAGWARKAEVDRMAERFARPRVTPVGRFEEDLSGLVMALPPPGPRYLFRVHGQKANNFLVDGYNKTARRHPALRQMSARRLTSGR